MKQLQAFPVSYNGRDGMTLRDYFAAKALQGLLSDTTVRSTPEEFAANSYMVADAMMKARES
jgi:hypothetical protein